MSGVQIGLGAIELTRIPCFTREAESDLVNETIAPFVAE
jgi:hypothetical protein